MQCSVPELTRPLFDGLVSGPSGERSCVGEVGFSAVYKIYEFSRALINYTVVLQ